MDETLRFALTIDPDLQAVDRAVSMVGQKLVDAGTRAGDTVIRFIHGVGGSAGLGGVVGGIAGYKYSRAAGGSGVGGAVGGASGDGRRIDVDVSQGG